MIDKHISSFKQQIVDAGCIQSASTTNRSSRSIIPLATAAFCLLNLHQSALAVDLKTQVAVDRPSSDSESVERRNHDEEYQHDRAPKLLSRLLGLIIYPFKDLASTLPEADEPAKNFHFDGMGGSFNQNLASLYLSQAELTSDKEFFFPTTIPVIEPIEPINGLASSTINLKREIYAVQPGDTLDRIADQHGVSREKLISLNQIEDSNLIFANQILELPVTNSDKTQSEELILAQTNLPQNANSASNSPHITDQLAKGKSNSKSISKSSSSADALQAERLANLRADISRLRAEIERDNDEDFESSDVDIISSVNSDRPGNSDLMTRETISLTLPPLPSSEEYLPEAFDGYTWPAQGILSSGYGWRWGRLHKGIDIAAPVGTPIFAAAGGEVISAGWNSGGYGNLIKLEHLDGSITLYAHNNRILVSNGQKVNQGQQIAEMGNTGFSTGSHLHFEIHSKNRGVVDPLALLSRN